MRPLSIRSRLTIWYSLILLVILVVVGGLSYSVLRTRLIHDVDASLLTVAQAVQRTSPPAVDDGPGPLEQWAREFLGPELYDKLFSYPSDLLARGLYTFVEQPLVAGGLTAISDAFGFGSTELSRAQNGLVRTYALALAGGVAILAVVFLSVR